MKLLDTSFLIHLQREWTHGETGIASSFLARDAGCEFRISVISALEFLEGYQGVRDGERFLEPFPQLEVTESVARTASRIRRSLRAQGEPVGDFAVLIAATALESSLPLVCDNLRHFQRIHGLVVECYRQL